eukprot:Gb_06557 [translate_table: standard]
MDLKEEPTMQERVHKECEIPGPQDG